MASARVTGDDLDLAGALNAIGWCHAQLGDHPGDLREATHAHHPGRWPWPIDATTAGQIRDRLIALPPP